MTESHARGREQRLSVREVSPAEYFSNPTRWNSLLTASGVDPLFNSLAWQHQWWRAFGERHALKSYFLQVVRGDVVVGQIPLVRRHGLRHRGFTICSVELLGNLFRGPATFRSEFLDVLCLPIDREAVAEALLAEVAADSHWDQFVLADIAADSCLLQRLKERPLPRSSLRITALDRGFAVSTEGRFETFRESLSASARRHMFGQRRRLERAIKGVAYLEDAIDLERLDRLYRTRWGESLLQEGRREFLEGLLGELPERRMLTSFMGHLEPVSALLNVHIGSRIYNLQGGFDSTRCPGISVATVHLGYLIEGAFHDPGVSHVELLQGGGMRSYYKARFARAGRMAQSLQVIRHAPLRAFYAIRDAVRGGPVVRAT